MLSRRNRLVPSVFIAAVLLLLYVRHYGYGYRSLSAPDWLHKGPDGATMPEGSITGTSPNTPDHVASSVDEPVPVQDQGHAVSLDTDSNPSQHEGLPVPIENSPSAGGTSPGPGGSIDVDDDHHLGPPAYSNPNKADDEGVNWSRFAYTQYVTDFDYLCNSLIMFEALHRLGAKADRVMLYPLEMLPDPQARASDEWHQKMLIMARDKYHVKLAPIEIQHREGAEETWADSFTKLLAFNQTQYDRVLNLDSDGVVLGSMDELFLLPQCPVAMPRAYWLLHDDPPRRILSSQIMLVKPSSQEFERIKAHIDNAGENDYDMEIVNHLYLDSAVVLPHRKYNLLTAEYRSKNHAVYLGSDKEKWDPVGVLHEAKFVHFSDWPIPKPWIPMEEEERLRMQPNCQDESGDHPDCTDREIWNGFYKDYVKQREKICFKMSEDDQNHDLKGEPTG